MELQSHLFTIGISWYFMVAQQQSEAKLSDASL